MFDWKDRGRAAGIHLCASMGVALVAALLVFGLWYPYPYREISGGRDLFLLVVGVDVVLGPLITFAIFNRAKPWKELRRDLAVVVALQLGGLAYGLWTVAVARPVHMVFEIDRFRVIHAVDVPPELLERAPAAVGDPLPLRGPTLLSLRPFRDENERADMTIAALSGIPLGARTELWQTYAAGRDAILAAAKPVSDLKARFPRAAAEIDAAAQRDGRTVPRVLYLPLIARKDTAWTVLLDAQDASILAYLPLDSF